MSVRSFSIGSGVPLTGGYDGALLVRGTTPAGQWTNTVKAQSASAIGLVVKGFAGQTANLQEWQNSASAVVGFVNPLGGASLGTNVAIVGGGATTPRLSILGSDDGTFQGPLLFMGGDTSSDLQYLKIFRTNNGHWVLSHQAMLYIRGLIDHDGTFSINSPTFFGAGPETVSWAHSDDIDRLIIHSNESADASGMLLFRGTVNGSSRVATFGLDNAVSGGIGLKIGQAPSDQDPVGTEFPVFTTVATTGKIAFGYAGGNANLAAQVTEQIVLPNAKYLGAVVFAGGAIAAKKLIGLNVADQVDIDPGALGVLIGGDVDIAAGMTLTVDTIMAHSPLTIASDTIISAGHTLSVTGAATIGVNDATLLSGRKVDTSPIGIVKVDGSDSIIFAPDAGVTGFPGTLFVGTYVPTFNFVVSGAGDQHMLIKETAGTEVRFDLSRHSTSQYANILFATVTTSNWSMGLRTGDSNLYVRDEVNGVNPLVITPGVTPNMAFTGTMSISGITTISGVGPAAQTGLLRVEQTELGGTNPTAFVVDQLNTNASLISFRYNSIEVVSITGNPSLFNSVIPVRITTNTGGSNLTSLIVTNNDSGAIALFDGGGGATFTINANGSATSTSVFAAGDGTAGAPGYGFTNATNGGGMFLVGGTTLGFSINGTRKMALDSASGIVMDVAVVAATDNSYDLGASGASRFRDLFLGRDATIGRDFYQVGRSSRTTQPITLAAAAATFAVTKDVIALTGDAGTNTVTTITGGLTGQVIHILFQDANVTMSDSGTGADQLQLMALMIGTADDTLTLIYNGTYWQEITRSVN